MSFDDRYLAAMGIAPRRVPHWEHFSCPAAESYLSGIDLYEHPRQCRLKLAECYPELGLPIPETDDPWPRPDRIWAEGESSHTDSDGHQRVRWGDGETERWDHGSLFKTAEDVFNFSPLAQPDYSDFPIMGGQFDFTSEERLYEQFRPGYPAEWGDTAPEGSFTVASYYRTMFMWPVLAFGWDLFLETCLDERFEPVMDEFAELNRRLFKAFARLPVNFVVCHDDLFTSQRPVCSPSWMHKYIFPRYEEFWGILKAAGKEVLFMADGCADAYADDIFACGARGIITEPYTDYKTIAQKHKDCFLAGEGDNRILKGNDPAAIKAMVEKMVETSKMTGGYMMCVGNHIPWDIPAEAIKLYLDLSKELAVR